MTPTTSPDPEPATASGGVDQDNVASATVAELASRGFDGLTLDGVAARAGVETTALREIWANKHALILAVLSDYVRAQLPLPDTGTLRGDLTAFATTLAGSLNTPQGRRLFGAMMVNNRDWDAGGTREQFVRANTERTVAILNRASARGEVREDIDPGRVIEMIAISIGAPMFVHDRLITEDDCAQVVDVVCRGIAR